MRRVLASAVTSRYAASPPSGFEGHVQPLDDIMNFLPLRDAFGEFCRKALCSEASTTGGTLRRNFQRPITANLMNGRTIVEILLSAFRFSSISRNVVFNHDIHDRGEAQLGPVFSAQVASVRVSPIFLLLSPSRSTSWWT